jgi:endonuclease-8
LLRCKTRYLSNARSRERRPELTVGESATPSRRRTLTLVPEGHTIHRLAREHREELAGHRLRVTSPQRRAEATARRLSGLVLEDVEPCGKHLFYRFRGGAILHVHLGRFGRFLRDLPEPRATSRLRIEAPPVTLDLVGPTVARAIDAVEEEAIRARIGPDPLLVGEADATWLALRRRRLAIGAALLDQRLFAGVGNIFRIEVLHALGIDPRRTARDLSRQEFEALWQTLTGMMRRSVAAGRIVSGPRGSRWVYQRETCARCGDSVDAYVLGGRRAYSCPTCQI